MADSTVGYRGPLEGAFPFQRNPIHEPRAVVRCVRFFRVPPVNQAVLGPGYCVEELLNRRQKFVFDGAIRPATDYFDPVSFERQG